MMLTIPSARRLLLPTVCVLITLVLLRLLSETGLLRHSQDALLQAALQRHLLMGGNAKVTAFNASTHPHLFTDRKTVHPPASHARVIPHANPLVKIFTQCPIPVNTHTGHVRLPNVLYNISLTPPPSPDGRQKRGESTQQNGEYTRFFNPAIIPLPYWSHPAKYILVSRVVTSGFHQESHICLADICLPPPDPLPSQRHAALPADARPCTASELSDTQLGRLGGLRCVTAPLKINIPPTPAEKCEGSWLPFPDIPGFHDPRVFWSGKGEPLILVNSASRYGCVGLWIVDLRKVFPVLESLLGREGSVGLGGLVSRDAAQGDQQGHEDGKKERGTPRSRWGLKPSMSYPHLTELTRNPRGSRASVEKNWLLWFPNADEAYVQYDLLGHAVVSKSTSGLETGHDPEALARLGLRGNVTQTYGYANVTNNTSLRGNSTMIPGRRESKRLESARRGGRTFAKLTGNGFTTPNLTHPDEQTCFSAEEGHFQDSLGSDGHWHQGSNSLRLILCTRAQARNDPACKDDDYADDQNAGSGHTGVVESGRSVHFAIMHRKFSNVLDLPLRYERYVVVWEGKEPFQILGVSQFPLLMKDEWAKPWTEDENWPNSGQKEIRMGWNATVTQASGEGWHRTVRRGLNEPEITEGFQKSSAYFTYTPSLAWTWRPHSAAANQEEEEDDVEYMSQLGTGYLGDVVLMGIGMDDVGQAFARVKVDDLLQCLRLCPGVKFADRETS